MPTKPSHTQCPRTVPCPTCQAPWRQAPTTPTPTLGKRPAQLLARRRAPPPPTLDTYASASSKRSHPDGDAIDGGAGTWLAKGKGTTKAKDTSGKAKDVRRAQAFLWPPYFQSS